MFFLTLSPLTLHSLNSPHYVFPHPTSAHPAQPQQTPHVFFLHARTWVWPAGEGGGPPTSTRPITNHSPVWHTHLPVVDFFCIAHITPLGHSMHHTYHSCHTYRYLLPHRSQVITPLGHSMHHTYRYLSPHRSQVITHIGHSMHHTYHSYHTLCHTYRYLSPHRSQIITPIGHSMHHTFSVDHTLCHTCTSHLPPPVLPAPLPTISRGHLPIFLPGPAPPPPPYLCHLRAQPCYSHVCRLHHPPQLS